MEFNRSRMTVADVRALKGVRQMSMVYVQTVEEAAACASAGIDVLSIEQQFWSPEMRIAAGDCFVQVGLNYGRLATTDDYLRAGHDALLSGGD
ncbi:MAG: 3-methyl-2-oxobutanoate hydroxymethyltransferase, partial [Ilumatobacteraceae bacterium]